MTGIAEFHREITGNGYGSMRSGIETECHGTRSLPVIDPFGNRNRFSEELNDGQAI